MARQLKYDQILLALMEYIGKSGLKPGERLPAERKLLPQLDCSMITLRRALTTLADRGVLERRQGDGTVLKQAVGQSASGGKVLYININVPGKISPAPSIEYEMLADNLRRHGLEMEYLSVHEFTDRIASAAQGAQGVLLYGKFRPVFLKAVQALGLPTVLIGGRFLSGRPFPQVTLDVISCARQITGHFLRDGARRIALLNSSPNYFMSRELELGFRKELETSGDSGVEGTVLAITQDDNGPLERFLEDAEEYDAVIMEVGNYLRFLAACRHCNRMPRTRIGVVPLTEFFRKDIMMRRLFHADRNTVLSRLQGDMFQIACDKLCARILHDTPITSCCLTAKLEGGMGHE